MQMVHGCKALNSYSILLRPRHCQDMECCRDRRCVRARCVSVWCTWPCCTWMHHAAHGFGRVCGGSRLKAGTHASLVSAQRRFRSKPHSYLRTHASLACQCWQRVLSLTHDRQWRWHRSQHCGSTCGNGCFSHACFIIACMRLTRSLVCLFYFYTPA